jgi:multidrug resistance efflux pump
MEEKKISSEKTSSVSKTSIFQHKRTRVVLSILTLCAAMGVLVWWYHFRPYVSTVDARVVTRLIRVAPNATSGRIERICFKEGDVVSQNSLLLELDHRTAMAQLMKAKAKYNMLTHDVSRTRQLNRLETLVSEKDLESVETNFLTAEGDMRLAEISFDNTYLRSPINGIIVQKNAEVGNLLDPSQIAFIISDIDHAWVEANIEETSVKRLKPGQRVAIKLDSGGSLRGKVSIVRQSTASQFALIPIENSGGNFTKVVQRIPVKIELDEHPNVKLWSGQSVHVRIRIF